MTERETLKLALEALELTARDYREQRHAITAIREALAEQPQQEPVAMYEDWYNPNSCGHCGMVGGHAKTCRHYTTPPQRKPLTDEEIGRIAGETLDAWSCARAIEAAHGIWPENSDCYGPDWTDRDGEYLK